MSDFVITAYGAVGDGTVDSTPALQAAINACHGAGGGRVVVPAPGVYLSGPFQLKSWVELHVEANATIRAIVDEACYTEPPFQNRSEGSMWISARGAEHIAITGLGTLDGRGTAFMENETPTHYNYKFVDGVDLRPHLLTLIGCRHITIRDVTFADAAYWCVHPAGCQDVVIDGVRIYNSLKVRNCDGIDIDHCRDVRISNCLIESADDCICIKNRRDFAEYGPCEHITITGCVLTSTSCALKLGSENVDAMRDIVVVACVIKASNRCLGIQNRDEGSIENVLFSDIVIESRLFADVWWGKSEPIYVTAFKRAPGTLYRFKSGATSGEIGPVRNIRFRNIVCRSEGGVYVSGCAESRITGLVFDDVRVEIDKTSKHRGGLLDRRPCDVEGIVAAPTAGFRIQAADDVTLRNCRVDWGANRPEYYGSALVAEDVSDMVLVGFRGEAAHPERDPATIVAPAEALRAR